MTDRNKKEQYQKSERNVPWQGAVRVFWQKDGVNAKNEQ